MRSVPRLGHECAYSLHAQSAFELPKRVSEVVERRPLTEAGDSAILAMLDPLAAVTPITHGTLRFVDAPPLGPFGYPAGSPSHAPLTSDGEGADSDLVYDLMNRNARNPKPANHGKRPCSHKRRKRKVRERAGNHWDMPTKQDKGCDS
jgi:hypothetical protein